MYAGMIVLPEAFRSYDTSAQTRVPTQDSIPQMSQTIAGGGVRTARPPQGFMCGNKLTAGTNSSAIPLQCQ